MFKHTVIAASLCLAACPAFANNTDSNNNRVSPLIKTDNPEYYLYLGAGLVGFEADANPSPSSLSSLDEEKKSSFAVGVGRDFNDYVALEGFYRYSSTEYNYPAGGSFLNNQSIDFHQIGISVIPSTGELGSSGIKLFARLSAAAVIIKQHYETTISDARINLEDDTGGIIDAGLGLQWNFGKQYMLRGEYITAVYDYSLDNMLDAGDFQGVQVSFGYRF
ncbi:outer membrane beta-barrel protein [Photobacterium lipolyticum]|nr:outer membrane beta-barrel protein [Photobacterium lipolyticum]